MHVTSVDTFQVAPRWLFVKIGTDDGVTGWGEASLEGYTDVVRSAVGALADYLIGRDPLPIEDHWQTMTKSGFYRGGPVLSSAVAGIDQALWDIAGKARGVPVYQLLGGPVRDRVRVYGWIGGDDPSEVAEAIAAQVSAGLTAVKMNASGPLEHLPRPAETAAIVERAAAARDALGPDRDIAIDFHGRISAPAARRLLPLLEPYHPLFIEEPVLPENNHAALSGSSPPPPSPSPRASACTRAGIFFPYFRAEQPSSSRICPTRAESPRYGESPHSPKPSTRPWLPTAR